MVSQGRNGFFKLGTQLIPLYNWRLLTPRNLVAGNPVGNSAATNAAEGAQYSRFICNFLVRDNTSEVMSLTAFWNLFMARTFSSGFDDTSTCTLIGASGLKSRTLTNCKAESFVLTIAYGSPIGLQCVFLCPGKPTLSTTSPMPVANYANTVDASRPLMFSDVTFSGISNGVYGAELSFSNNHLPDAPLNGTKVLNSWDAGVATAGLTLKVKENTDTGSSAGNYSIPYADASDISVTIAGVNATRVFAYPSVTMNDPNDVDVPVGQIYQTISGLCLATMVSGTYTPPMVIS